MAFIVLYLRYATLRRKKHAKISKKHLPMPLRLFCKQNKHHKMLRNIVNNLLTSPAIIPHVNVYPEKMKSQPSTTLIITTQENWNKQKTCYDLQLINYRLSQGTNPR